MWNNDINTVLMMFVLNTICYQQNYVILLRVSSKSRPTCRAGLRVPNKADFNFSKDTLLERMNMIYWGTEYRRCLDSNGPSGCSVWGAPSCFYSLSRGLLFFWTVFCYTCSRWWPIMLYFSFFSFFLIFSCISTSFLYLCVFILYLLSFLLPSLHLPACQLWHYHTTNPDKLVAVCLLAVIQTNSSYNIFYQSCLFEKWPILSGQSFKHHETFSGYVYSLSH